MSKSVARMLFCACIMFSGSANAFDLNGNWTADDRNCDKVFVKKKQQNFDDQKLRRFWRGLYS